MPATTRARTGDYRHRITILTNTTTKDTFGQEKRAWNPSGEAMWCSIEPEFRPTDIFLQTSAVHHYEQKLWFRTRFRSDIDQTKMRLRHAIVPGGTVTIRQQGAAGIDAQQTIRITGAPIGGTFTLTYSGQTTAPIAFDSTANAVATALTALSSIGAGNVTVTGATAGPWLVTFTQTLGAQAIALLLANATSLTPPTTEGAAAPQIIVATTRNGKAGTNASQMVSLSKMIGGTFTLTYNGQTTAAIPYNSAAAGVATALKALSNIGDNDVAVTGANSGPWLVTFQNALGNQQATVLTVNTTALTNEPPTDYEILTIEDPTGHNREIRLLCREVQQA